MTSMAGVIPVIDFSDYGLDVSEENVTENDLKHLADSVYEAFSTIGFCYIKNHGLLGSQITEAFNVSKDFFEHPSSVKKKYTRPVDANHGWVATEREMLNPDRKVGDLKEAYNFTLSDDIKVLSELKQTILIAQKEYIVPDFHQCLEKLFKQCTFLADRVFDVMSIGLNLPKNFLRNCHRCMGQKTNQTTLRSLYYPEVKDLKPGQIRCGEHSDYGTITFLFQTDDGLEVMNKQGVYIQAPPIPDTVLINIGDLMQRWTADKLLASKHKVGIPKDMQKKQGRQSLAFFIHPDDEILVKCLDGSDKYPPISSLDYLNMRFGVTY